MDFRPSYVARGIVVGLLLLTASQPALASTGTIDATNHYAWDDNGGYVNWYATGGNVTVTDTTLTGYIWSAGFGWINLSPTQGGVTNNAGVLGGYAWGANTGWINFAGVTIDSNGLFHGQTTAQSLFGTMTFDCAYCNVTTTWRSSTVAPTITTNTGSGGGTISGPLSYGYQNGSTAAAPTTAVSQPPASLTPPSPPPKTEPTTSPESGIAPTAHLTPSITLSISSNPTDVIGTPIIVHVVIGSSQRSQNITLGYRLYSSSGATVYSSPKTLAPHDPSSFSISIPGNIPIGAYTIAVSAQYGKQPIHTQTLPISIYSKQTEASAHASNGAAMQPAAPVCSWLSCWWSGIVSFFTHLF